MSRMFANLPELVGCRGESATGSQNTRHPVQATGSVWGRIAVSNIELSGDIFPVPRRCKHIDKRKALPTLLHATQP